MGYLSVETKALQNEIKAHTSTRLLLAARDENACFSALPCCQHPAPLLDWRGGRGTPVPAHSHPGTAGGTGTTVTQHGASRCGDMQWPASRVGQADCVSAQWFFRSQIPEDSSVSSMEQWRETLAMTPSQAEKPRCRSQPGDRGGRTASLLVPVQS